MQPSIGSVRTAVLAACRMTEQKGGHSVPESDIRRRFVRSIHNFWRLYRPLADHWLLIYNSGSQPLDVAAGTAEDVSIRDAEMFDLFNRLIDG